MPPHPKRHQGDIAAQELFQHGSTAFATMDESDAAWQQVAIGQLPADADQRGNPQFYLVPIRKPLNADKGAGQRKVFPIAAHVQAERFDLRSACA